MTAPIRKRSRHVALFLAGTAVLGLAACEEEKTDAAAFPDLESCVAEAQQGSLFFTEEDCRTQFAQAEQTHLETAPRYDSKELCEQEHGAGNCEGDPAAQNQSSGGSIFMPMLMGYMIGSMLGGGRGVMSQPMVGTSRGGYATPDGKQTFANNRGTGRVAGSAFTKGPATIGKAPMTPAQVSQRGGFGASSTARSGGARSYGG
ncbi:DUF1190 domain-containing protein [Paracoccus aerodenitrificans]|uniref:DUF1190 domain-containing protein n=1 Tax=Paracoccus aerodenitrificans TaxID=3017781 RepID=UPI0022F00497|nr:DUF1190 domain-containing protein [Paracoccus aerodenitrificans]WBU62911.1 DUF1190 domain-containing protein [Paracoccus aerodenitrificans]